MLTAYCDGSFERRLGRYAYGVVILGQEGVAAELQGRGDDSRFVTAHNVAGEIMGALAAMEWAAAHGERELTLCHDYEGVAKWLTGAWQAKSEVAKMYVAQWRGRYAAALGVSFRKVKGHSGDRYNDRADALARAALLA